MDQIKLRSYLRSTIRKEGRTQSAFAKILGVSPQYLGDVLSGRRDPGDKILDAMGFERVVSYRWKRS